MSKKLYATCFQVRQEIVYLIFQKLLNYPWKNKLKRFEKPVISIIADICFLVKRLQAAITPN